MVGCGSVSTLIFVRGAIFGAELLFGFEPFIRMPNHARDDAAAVGTFGHPGLERLAATGLRAVRRNTQTAKEAEHRAEHDAHDEHLHSPRRDGCSEAEPAPDDDAEERIADRRAPL